MDFFLSIKKLRLTQKFEESIRRSFLLVLATHIGIITSHLIRSQKLLKIKNFILMVFYLDIHALGKKKCAGGSREGECGEDGRNNYKLDGHSRSRVRSHFFFFILQQFCHKSTIYIENFLWNVLVSDHPL